MKKLLILLLIVIAILAIFFMYQWHSVPSDSLEAGPMLERMYP